MRPLAATAYSSLSAAALKLMLQIEAKRKSPWQPSLRVTALNSIPRYLLPDRLSPSPMSVTVSLHALWCVTRSDGGEGRGAVVDVVSSVSSSCRV